MNSPTPHFDYSSSVFLNCPFDEQHRQIMEAIVFAVYDCGFVARCSLEESDSSNVRLDKIMRIVAGCKFGIHDISSTDLDADSNLPRFNMPLELGIFLGAKQFGAGRHRQKNCLIMDREKYRHQKFISDLAGNDVCSHDGDPGAAIGEVRSWLSDLSGRRLIPGKNRITGRYAEFRGELPRLCKGANLEVAELTYNEYSVFVSGWLSQVGS